MPRRLTIKGDFRVDGGHHRHLNQQARRLGFADLRACLQALLDEGWLATVGWTSSSAGSGYAPDLQYRMAACGWR